MTNDKQKGISLIVVFLIMTIILAMTLASSTVLFNKIKILSSMGDSVSALYAAESGVEKTLYFDRKQIPGKGKDKGNRGLCDICSSCTDCANCTLTPLSTNGCNPLTCTDCEINYNSVFNNRTYFVNAKATPSLFFSCEAEGNYKNAKRTVKVISSSISAVPIEE